mmetsp:Transcript_15768/g.39322  ORF Transcript_15768/g.39322 Transcript_15768/m.39322 type:complete len:224 (+) Transcript_15768:1525-2196(+)
MPSVSSLDSSAVGTTCSARMPATMVLLFSTDGSKSGSSMSSVNASLVGANTVTVSDVFFSTSVKGDPTMSTIALSVDSVPMFSPSRSYRDFSGVGSRGGGGDRVGLGGGGGGLIGRSESGRVDASRTILSMMWITVLPALMFQILGPMRRRAPLARMVGTSSMNLVALASRATVSTWPSHQDSSTCLFVNSLCSMGVPGTKWYFRRFCLVSMGSALQALKSYL